MIRTVDAYVAPGLALLADWSIRWGVLIGLLAAWWLVRPPRRASTRHLLGLAVMVAGLLLPALPRWGSGWTWPGPDAGPVARTPDVAPEGPVAVEPPWIAAPAVEVEAQVPRAEATIDRPVVRTPAPRPTAEPLGAWRVALLALGVAWAGGVAVAASRLVLGWLWLARLKRVAAPVDGGLAREFEAYRAELGMRRRARLATHPDVGSPVTLGGFRPVVVVPNGWSSLPEPARRAGSLHELAHLARGDDWARLGQEAVRAVFWFHPAVHWLLNRIDRERELLCDEAAVTRGVPPRDLARMLLEFAKRPRVRGSAPQAMPFLSRGTVKARIGRLLEDDAMRWMGPLTRGRAIALGLVAIALALGAGSVRVSGAGTPPIPGDGDEASRAPDHLPAADEPEAPVVRLQDAGDSVSSIAFSRDGSLLAAAGDRITVFDPRSRRLLRSIEARSRAIALTPDGSLLAAVVDRGAVRLWEPRTGAEVRTIEVEGLTPLLSAVAFSPNSRTLAVGGSEGPDLYGQGDAVWLWDVDAGAWLGRLKRGTTGVNSVAFSPDGKMLAAGGGDGIVRAEVAIWDWRAKSGLEGFQPDRVGVVVAQMRLNPGPYESSRGTDGWVNAVAFDPEGRRLAVAGMTAVDPDFLNGKPQREVVRLYDARTGSDAQILVKPGDPLPGDGAFSVAFSPDGRTLAVGCHDDTVKLWDAETGSLRRILPTRGLVAAVAFSPDGKTLAVGDSRLGLGLIALDDEAARPPARPDPEPAPEPREPVRVEIPLKIRVLDAETDRPIARFGVERRWVDLPEATRVMWFDAGPFPTPRMIESPDGSHDPKFVYYDDGRRRCDWLRVVADGYLPQTATAEPLTPMDADGEILSTIRLHRGRTVTGRVLDRDGKPAAGARVMLLRRDGGTITLGTIARYFAENPDIPGITNAVADVEGRFAIEGVGDDNALGVHAPPVPLWVAPVPAGASEMTVRLPETGAMRLRYDIEGGAPKATGFVQLVQPGAPEVAGWESLQMQFHPEIPNGDEVTLEGLSPGRYRVSRDFGPFALDASEVVVKPGETADVPFVRDSGHPVEGEVAGLDRLDKPQGVTGLDQVFVAVEAGPGPMSGVVDVVQADPGGRFRTTRIPPGTYLARAYGYTEAIMRRQAMFSGLATPGVIGETRVTVTADRPPPPVKIPLNEDAVRSGASAPPPGAGPAAELRPMADEPRAEHEVRVRGVVVDAETRRPITRFVEQGGMADAKDPSKVQWGFSETRRGENPEGTFSVTVGGPSRLRVRFLADGYRPEPVPVDPSEVGPGDIEVVVKMRRGEPVAGRVLDHEGRPVAGASVFLVSGLPLTISGGKAVLPFGPPGGEEPSATKTTTDAQGRFTLTGNGGDAALVAVSCPALDVWVVPVPEDGRELTIRLPRPGGLEIHYDLPGADPEGEIVIQLTEPRWERVSHVLRPKVRNGDTLVLDNLTPGTYDVARYKQVKAGDDPREGARGLFLDRRTLVIASGETARIEYFHKVSHRVSGRVVGLGETGAGGAIVTVEDPDEDPTNRTPRKRMIHDAVGTGKDGAFTTASLFPGTYTLVAEVYPPEKDDGVFRTGWRLPAFVGTARVTVPALSGERAPDVTIEVRPYEPPRPEAPRQSADPSPLAAAPAARGAMEFTLVGPDGRPIPDAEVALCSLRGPVQIRGGKLSDPEAVRRTTGPEGRATFPRPEARGVLVAIHDRGISVEPILPDTAAIRAVLDPWGRVEGTLLWGTEPGAGEPIGLTSLRPLGPKPFAPDAPPEIEFYDEAATDAAGRFAFERVAPGGPVQLSRFVDGYLAAYDHVEVEPGSTARATVGGVGPPVVGRVELTPELAKVSGDLRKIKVGITLRPPSVSGPQDAVQEQYRLHRAFLDSDRGRLHLRKDIPLDDDGAFRVEGLPPQQYVIYVSVFGEITEHIRPFGFLAHRFEVPAVEGAEGRDVVDLGVLRPASTED